MPNSIRPGDVIADRYRMVDLLRETAGGLFWRAHDQVLARHVAFHVIRATDPRAPLLLDAAKRSATVVDARILRVLDADERNDLCYVVNEWGSGQSLDILLAEGPLSARRAAWIVSEVAETIAKAHDQEQAHGRLVPENVLIDHNGTVKIIGFAVDAALHGLPAGRVSTDTVDLAGILYAALVGEWPGVPGPDCPRHLSPAGSRCGRGRFARASPRPSTPSVTTCSARSHTPREPTPGALRRPPTSTTPWSPSSATRVPWPLRKPTRLLCCPGRVPTRPPPRPWPPSVGRARSGLPAGHPSDSQPDSQSDSKLAEGPEATVVAQAVTERLEDDTADVP